MKQLQAEGQAQRDLIAAQAADLAARGLHVKEAQHALAGAQHEAQRAQQAAADAQQVRFGFDSRPRQAPAPPQEGHELPQEGHELRRLHQAIFLCAMVVQRVCDSTVAP